MPVRHALAIAGAALAVSAVDCARPPMSALDAERCTPTARVRAKLRSCAARCRSGPRRRARASRSVQPDHCPLVFHAVGHIPDVVVEPTLEDLRRGRDTVLLRAVAELRSDGATR